MKPTHPIPHGRRLAFAHEASLVAVLLAACAPEAARTPEAPPAWQTEHGVVDGTVELLTFSGPAGEPSGPLHGSTWVNGAAGYAGMEDNDLRGYLDGRYKYAWNQPGQVHVRIGRRARSPRWGELELFRVLHRWDDVVLPPGSRVIEAALALSVEEGPERRVRLMLYSVTPDFDPGSGGTLGNNVSPPRPGEVWWNDVGFQERPWSLPGAGYADDGLEGDTGRLPLATALWTPGEPTIRLASERLARYAQRQIERGEALRFLIRLSDLDEDTPGSAITIFSGSTGESWTVSRRPALELVWRSPAPAGVQQAPVLLEYGRTHELPRVATGGPGTVSLAFTPADSSLTPTLEVRGGSGEVTDSWRPVTAPVRHEWQWVQARIVAAPAPLRLGQDFEAELVDTWIRTGPPESQRVPFVFHSPTGTVDTVLASYVGDNRWTVRFEPRVLGPWRYEWSQDFTDLHHEGALGRIDVVAGPLAELRAALGRLGEALAAPDGLTRAESARRMVEFMRLERALIRELGPGGFESAEGREIRSEIDDVRELLGGDPVPDSLEMVPDVPPRWARDEVEGR